MDFYYMELPSYISIVICALVGLVLLFIKFSKFEVSITITNYLITFSLATVLLQVLIVVYYSQSNEIGSFSMFYNIVNLFVLTFLYIYRNEMRLNYYLYWSFALFFLMGMEIRAIQTLGLGLN
ncbi:MAG: hypothetical protein CL511_03695 [Actinobacteria bacterium]|jgi:uncharacterized membrane protein|nr:hypothetical protein [Actinomycetota bacterium]|tara:strand:+ start:451 stop:819 length:369 start_codon:yes stop_codon:yes gene_type:complete